jgi:hypothetical protein
MCSRVVVNLFAVSIVVIHVFPIELVDKYTSLIQISKQERRIFFYLFKNMPAVAE